MHAHDPPRQPSTRRNCMRPQLRAHRLQERAILTSLRSKGPSRFHKLSRLSWAWCRTLHSCRTLLLRKTWHGQLDRT